MITIRHYNADSFYRRKDLDIFLSLTNGRNGAMIDTLFHRHPEDHIFVMRENGNIIGWVNASRLWSGSYDRWDSFYVSFFIDKKHRGRGLAKRFPAALRRWIPDGNYVLGFHYESVRRIMNKPFVEVIERNDHYYGWDKYKLKKNTEKQRGQNDQA